MQRSFTKSERMSGISEQAALGFPLWPHFASFSFVGRLLETPAQPSVPNFAGSAFFYKSISCSLWSLSELV